MTNQITAHQEIVRTLAVGMYYRDPLNDGMGMWEDQTLACKLKYKRRASKMIEDYNSYRDDHYIQT